MQDSIGWAWLLVTIALQQSPFAYRSTCCLRSDKTGNEARPTEPFSLLTRQSTIILIQTQLLTVTPLTVTVGYSDTFSVSQTITNDLEAVIVTNMRLEWHFELRDWSWNEGKMLVGIRFGEPQLWSNFQIFAKHWIDRKESELRVNFTRWKCPRMATPAMPARPLTPARPASASARLMAAIFSPANLMALDRMKGDINKMAFSHVTQPTMESISGNKWLALINAKLKVIAA